MPRKVKKETITPPSKADLTDAGKQLKKKHPSGGRVLAEQATAKKLPSENKGSERLGEFRQRSTNFLCCDLLFQWFSSSPPTPPQVGMSANAWLAFFKAIGASLLVWFFAKAASYIQPAPLEPREQQPISLSSEIARKSQATQRLPTMQFSHGQRMEICLTDL